MYKTLRKVALLLSLVCAVVCCAVFGAACNPADKKVTYSVTVTTEHGDAVKFGDLKAQWLSGTDAASEEIALDSQGKASVELEAGDYTVTLKGLPQGYTFESASVTAKNTSANIEVVAAPSQDYTVTVSAEEGITLPANISVRLYDGERAVGNAVALTNGSAKLSAYAGSYTVRLTGLPMYLSYEEKTVTAAAPTAAIVVAYAEGNYTVSVAITVPVGITLPEELAVQAFDGEDAVGVPAEITAVGERYSANVTAPYGIYEVRFIGLPDYLTYEAPQMTPVSGLVTIGLSIAEVEYEVTVTCANEEILSGVTVVLNGADGEAASDKIHLTDGAAKFTVIAGKYDVVLEGFDAENYYYEPVKLTMSERKAEIELKAVVYVVKVDLPENAEGIGFSQITVKLTGDSGEDKTGTPDASGVVTISAPRDSYTVELTLPQIEGKNFTYVLKNALTESVRETTVYVAEVPEGGDAFLDESGWDPVVTGDPYEITAAGRYYLAPESHDLGWYAVRQAHIHFTAPMAGLYSFTWTDTSVFGDTYVPDYEEWTPIYKDDISLRYVIEEGEEVKFMLDYSDGIEEGFIVEITWAEPPVDGDMYKPLNAAIGENTAEGRTDAYYILPSAQNGHSFEVTFGENLTVYHISGNVTNTPVVVNSGDIVTPASYSTEYIHVVAQNGAEIKFTLADVLTPGTGLNPYVIELDKDVEYTFSGYSSIWYSFTPAESGLYRIVPGQNFTSINVFSSYDSEGGYGDGQIGEQITAQNPAKSVVELTAETKYYLELGYSLSQSSVSFKIIKFSAADAQEGELWKPKAAEAKNTVDFTASPSVYFKYTVPSDGYLLFTYENWILIEGVNTYFYSDDAYSEPIVGDIYDIDYQYLGSTYYWYDGKHEVKTGDVIYFYIDKAYSTAMSVTFEISVSETIPERPVFELSEGKAVDVILIPDNYAINEIIKLVNVTAGSYKLKIESLTESNPFSNVLHFTAGDNTIETEPNYEASYLEVDLTIPAECDELAVHVDSVGMVLYLRLTLTKTA